MSEVDKKHRKEIEDKVEDVKKTLKASQCLSLLMKSYSELH